MGLRYVKRLPNRLCNKTSSNQVATPPHYSAEQNSLIEQEVRHLLQKKAVSRLQAGQSREGFYSTLFLVPKTDGGQRPIINLKALNMFVCPEHFKMEGIHTLKDFVKWRDWMAKVDLKDAHFMIPIHTTQRKYVPQICNSKEQLRVQLSPIRFVISTMGLYQDPQASGSTDAGNGGENGCLHRRHPHSGRFQRVLRNKQRH